MKNKFKQIIKESKGVHLTKEEKLGALRILQAHMDSVPVIERGGVRLGYKGQKQTKFALKFMPLVIALFLAVSGGTALAANGALPGDLLYPVKVGFNEQVVDILSLTSEAKAKHQSELAAERIEELQELSVRGILNAEVKARAGVNFEKHTEKALKLIEKLEEKGKFEAAAEISSRLEALLKAHQNLIDQVSATVDTDDDEDTDLDDILEKVNNRIKTVTEIREKAEKHMDDDEDEDEDESKSARLDNAASVKAKQSQEAIDEAKELFDQYASVLNDSLEDKIESLIDEAEDAHEDGEEALEDGNSVNAFWHFQVSLRLTHQAKVMMRAWVSFDLDLDDDDENEDEDEEENEETKISTEDAEEITASGAKLACDVEAGDEDVNVWFDWDNDDEDLDNETSKLSVDANTDTTVKIGIGSLATSTQYYFRCAAEDDGDELAGTVKSFTTLAE